MYFLDPQNFSSHYLHTTHKRKETHPIMLQRNCIFSTFKFIVATGKEFVPLVPAKSGSKCTAMEILVKAIKCFIYTLHILHFFSRQTSSIRGYGMKVFHFIYIFVIFLEMNCSVFLQPWCWGKFILSGSNLLLSATFCKQFAVFVIVLLSSQCTSIICT